MNIDKGKATWDHTSTKIFIDECIDQIYKEHRQGTSFTKDGWKNIESGFNEKAGKCYDKKKLKNRLNSLRKEWRSWDTLFSKETGIAFDNARNMVIADDMWWERKTKENPLYEKYRYNGLKFARELQILFKDVIALDENMWAPFSTQTEALDDDQDDVYQPSMDVVEEGSGDSEEKQFGANTGDSFSVTTDFEGMTAATNSIGFGSRSLGKRKMREGSKRVKKAKMTVFKQIADAVIMMAMASKESVEILKNRHTTNAPPMEEVITHLLSIEEIDTDDDFSSRVCNMMLHPQCRQVFAILKNRPNKLLAWLRYHAYKTPPKC